MTLYHTTSAIAARSILATGFRRGKAGLCGGAIYFIDQPYLKKSKFAPGVTQRGAILEVVVDMGKIAWAGDRRCLVNGWFGVESAKAQGYNSLKYDAGDGCEYIIWESSQVKSVRIFRYM